MHQAILFLYINTMDEIDNYQQADLRALSQIRHSYHHVGSADGGLLEALIIRFVGSYGKGSSGNDDASYMLAIAAAGIEAWRPNALVFDMRAFAYVWGDRLQNVLGIGRQKVDTLEDVLLGKKTDLKKYDIPTAIVVSDLCREGVESLVREEMRRDPRLWLFETIDKALKAVRK